MIIKAGTKTLNKFGKYDYNDWIVIREGDEEYWSPFPVSDLAHLMEPGKCYTYPPLKEYEGSTAGILAGCYLGSKDDK